MNNDFEKHARSIANSSGFPLQIRVADIANSAPKWRVLVEEHPWHFEETRSEGFLDLVVIDRVHNLEAMVIECKRVRQAAWVFLIAKTDPIKRTHARLWDSRYTKSRWDRFGWFDWQSEPSSYESKFCAIPGQEQGRRNLLERTASELIMAIEALAQQDKELHQRKCSQVDFNQIYIPVVVTTAELIVSHFEPKTISLNDGCLPSNAAFTKVSSVRFRKSLDTRLISSSQNSIQEAHSESERTVFIVNSEGLQEFFNQWSIR